MSTNESGGRIPILLTREDRDLVLAAISTQMGYERRVVEHRENYTPLFAEDAKRRLDRYRAIAAQLRAQTGEGE